MIITRLIYFCLQAGPFPKGRDGMRSKSRNRTRAYYRHQRSRVIQRKSKLAKQLGWHEKCIGKFAKGKIHCSCSYCRRKTREMGLPKSEIVKVERMGELNDVVELMSF
ncbi:hypothetical protein D1872_270720 [compost metagenome]